MRWRRVVPLLALTLVARSAPITAQTQPASRGDVSATAGWLAVEGDVAGPLGSRRWESSLFGAVGAGWHWTDHLKTEVDFGAGTTAETYAVVSVTIDGLTGQRAVEPTSSRRVLGISQQYQFFRNAWFHPHVAAGASLAWDKVTDHFEPVFVFDPVTRTSRLAEPARTVGPRTEFSARPFVAAGFKAYITRRAFFRTDLRVGFKSGLNESMLRFGFGTDF